MRSKMEALGWFTAFVGMIGLLVFSPVLTFGLAWLGGWILKVCVGNAMVGISGGKDSSIVAALCVEALGAKRVVGVMMPNGEQPDLADSHRVIESLGIRFAYVDIIHAVQTLSIGVSCNMGVSEQAAINLPARIRMATLYAVAQSLPNGEVVDGKIQSWRDYEDGDQIQVTVDGKTYLVHSTNIALIND